MALSKTANSFYEDSSLYRWRFYRNFYVYHTATFQIAYWSLLLGSIMGTGVLMFSNFMYFINSGPR